MEIRTALPSDLVSIANLEANTVFAQVLKGLLPPADLNLVHTGNVVGAALKRLTTHFLDPNRTILVALEPSIVGKIAINCISEENRAVLYGCYVDQKHRKDGRVLFSLLHTALIAIADKKIPKVGVGRYHISESKRPTVTKFFNSVNAALPKSVEITQMDGQTKNETYTRFDLSTTLALEIVEEIESRARYLFDD